MQISLLGAGIFLGSAFLTLVVSALHDWRRGKVHDMVFFYGLSGMALGGFIYAGIPMLLNMVGLSLIALLVGVISVKLDSLSGADVWGLIIYAVSSLLLSMPAMILSYAVTVPIYRFLYIQKFESLREDEGVRALPGFLLAWIIGVAASLLI